MKKKKTHPAVKVLSLFIPLLLILLFLILRNIAGFRTGSDTKYGAVCMTIFQGKIFYQWCVFNPDGSVRDSDITMWKPYIWEKDDHVKLLLTTTDPEMLGLNEKKDYFNRYYRCYDFPPDGGDMEEGFPDIPEISNNLKLDFHAVSKMKTNSPYVEVYDCSFHHVPWYYYIAFDVDHEEAQNEFSDTLPEVQEQPNGKLHIIYTSHYDHTERLSIFDPQGEDFSYDYILYENRTVFLEDHVGDFYFTPDAYHHAHTDHFINTEPCEILTSLEDVYFRARNEISIPYSLVTFCRQGILYPSYWKVTFSQMDHPEKESQTVYLTGEGITVLLLDGKPSET